MKSEEFLRYFLPKEFSEHFELKEVKEQSSQLTLCLDERLVLPPEHSDKDLESKGFKNSVSIQDFPIRDKQVFLEIRCRKWTDKKTGKVYSRDWQLAAKGTSLTKEFAVFLKELVR